MKILQSNHISRLYPRSRPSESQVRQRERPTEYRVNHIISLAQRAVKVFRERDLEIAKLCREALIQLVLALLRVEDGRLVAEMMQMARGNEAVASCTSRE